MRFTLELRKTESGRVLLEGRTVGKESQTLEYYDVDGEGGEAPFTSVTPWNEKTEPLGIQRAYYDTDDAESFWRALERVIRRALKADVELPEYHYLSDNI
jgi:hypothetical protein